MTETRKNEEIQAAFDYICDCYEQNGADEDSNEMILANYKVFLETIPSCATKLAEIAYGDVLLDILPDLTKAGATCTAEDIASKVELPEIWEPNRMIDELIVPGLMPWHDTSLESLANLFCFSFGDYKKLLKLGLDASWIIKETECAKRTREDLFDHTRERDRRFYLDLYYCMSKDDYKEFLEQMVRWDAEKNNHSLSLFEYLCDEDDSAISGGDDGPTFVDVMRLFMKYDYDMYELFSLRGYDSPLMSRLCRYLEYDSDDLTEAERSKVLTEFVAGAIRYVISGGHPSLLDQIKQFVNEYGEYFEINDEDCWDVARKYKESVFLEGCIDAAQGYDESSFWNESHGNNYTEYLQDLYFYISDCYGVDLPKDSRRESILEIYELFFWQEEVFINYDTIELLLKEKRIKGDNETERMILVFYKNDDEEFARLKTLYLAS